MRRFWLLAPVLAAATFAGCQQSDNRAGYPRGSWPTVSLVNKAAAAEAARGATGWSTIKGQIVWGEDKIPEMPVLKVDKDQDHCLSKGPIHSEDWVINPKNKGIRWVFVWLAPEPSSAVKKLPIHPSLKEVPKKEVTLDQPVCRFIPHALAIREGQTILVKNSAPIAHNVHWTGFRNPGGNQLLAAGSSIKIKNLKADRYPIQIACNIHPWMSAWLRVFDHPYFAVTDANGKFEIPKAPAGKYRLVVWHPSVGFRGGAEGRNGIPIIIKENGVTTLKPLDLKSKYD